jgi:hypothetical protein
MRSPKKSDQNRYNRAFDWAPPPAHANDNRVDWLAGIRQFSTILSEESAPRHSEGLGAVCLAMVSIVVLGWGVVLAESLGSLERLLF